MVLPQIDTTAPMLEGKNEYTGWFLTFAVDEAAARRELGINNEQEAKPRLMLLRLGDRGAFKVSPVTGKVLGFELFGIRLMSSEILRDPTPRAAKAAALSFPLK